MREATASQIDISNLRFYADMARQFHWQTDIIDFRVIEQTLNEIASRYEALAIQQLQKHYKCKCNHLDALLCHECEESTGVCACKCHILVSVI